MSFLFPSHLSGKRAPYSEDLTLKVKNVTYIVEVIATYFVHRGVTELIFILIYLYMCYLNFNICLHTRSKELILTNVLMGCLQLCLPLSHNGHFCKSPL